VRTQITSFVKQMLLNTFLSKEDEVRILGREELDQLHRSINTLSSNVIKLVGYAYIR